MNFHKTGLLLLPLLLISPVAVHAQTSSDPMNSYTPPPMFGSAVQSQPVTSATQPVSAPEAPAKPEVPIVAQKTAPAPAPAPVVTPAPAVTAPVFTPKKATLVAKPPQDKEETVLKSDPLPIEPIVKRQAQKPVTPPDKESIPAYVAPVPVVKKPETPPEAKPVPAHEAEPKPEPKVETSNPVPGLKAEDLLGHAVTTDDTAPSVPVPGNPLAVPAPKVGSGLPLPGSIAKSKTTPPKPKNKDVKQVQKTEVKKPAVKPAPKAEPKKIVKKPVAAVPVKPEVKPKAKAQVRLENKPEPLISDEDRAMVKAAEGDSKIETGQKRYKGSGT